MLVYLCVLAYFLFFSEKMGRNDVHQEYRYNLQLFQEIKRFAGSRHRYPLAFFLNVIGNVLAFMPFGRLMPQMCSYCRKWWVTMAFSMGLSLLAELVQLVGKLGCFDVDDLVLNTIGGICGYLIYCIWQYTSASRHKEQGGTAHENT